MNAAEMASSVKVGLTTKRFAISTTQAVRVTCNECGGAITVPVDMGPEYAVRWGVQHRTSFHTKHNARPKPIGKEATRGNAA